MIEVLEYQDSAGRSAFASWFDDLDAPAAAKVNTTAPSFEVGTGPMSKRR